MATENLNPKLWTPTYTGLSIVPDLRKKYLKKRQKITLKGQ